MTDLETAAQAVDALDSAPAVQGADDIAEAFERAGERIAASLENAAERGSLSFSDMAESVLSDLARLAVSELIEAPLSALLDGLGSALSGDGPTPQTTVTLNVSGASDASGFKRSEGQIAAGLARAVATGRGRI